jgi:DNA-binding response OmpR family regulator
MPKVLILYQSEGAALLERDLVTHDFDAVNASIADAEEAMTRTGLDAVILEVTANQEETRRLIESPARASKVPLLLLLRIDQVGAIDPAWAVDDLIIMPAAAQEVVLRLRRAVWRKSGLDSENTLRSGDLLVDLANYKVFVAEQPVNLTFKEFELLRFLMTNRGKVFTREALLNRVWGYEYFGGARTVDVHIRRLRSKIETGATVYIETVRNVGYRFPAGS